MTRAEELERLQIMYKHAMQQATCPLELDAMAKDFKEQVRMLMEDGTIR